MKLKNSHIETTGLSIGYSFSSSKEMLGKYYITKILFTTHWSSGAFCICLPFEAGSEAKDKRSNNREN